ncbi:MAG: DUF2284 domain-containing protein [Clostridiales bacterium]|nr:DUF2284 domain-containing protein [Clostridiales bacterium]
MSNKEKIESIILQYPICEYYFGTEKELIFSDKVWYICEQDCERYGHSWACPPYCGQIEELMRKCREYSSFCLFSTVTETENAWDKKANLKVKRYHEEITKKIRDELKNELPDFYCLSTGCTECEECACPDEPCRHPEGRLSSLESHGILVMQTVEETGLTFNYGGDTIVYFSMILFNDRTSDETGNGRNFAG